VKFREREKKREKVTKYGPEEGWWRWGEGLGSWPHICRDTTEVQGRFLGQGSMGGFRKELEGNRLNIKKERRHEGGRALTQQWFQHGKEIF